MRAEHHPLSVSAVPLIFTDNSDVLMRSIETYWEGLCVVFYIKGLFAMAMDSGRLNQRRKSNRALNCPSQARL